MNGLAVFPVRRDLQDGRTTQSAMGNQHFFVLEKRSEEHTSELQSRLHLVCRLLLEKKKKGAHDGLLLLEELLPVGRPVDSSVVAQRCCVRLVACHLRLAGQRRDSVHYNDLPRRSA